ncbi:MAG TPA: type II toxin-antitoxin system VapB family antitoxin [Rhizomicrobium sp.]|nr:type II toxin-antitoxin system VapB family antitoxin [Rhizomicrobium sp.]
MKDQVHIRNREAAHLARTLARETGVTISDIVLEALRQYRPQKRKRQPARVLSRWRKLLEADRKALQGGPEIPVESLYDEATGLPK